MYPILKEICKTKIIIICNLDWSSVIFYLSHGVIGFGDDGSGDDDDDGCNRA